MDDEYMLTTIDNPYDPFTQFEGWYAYDEQNGYHSCGLLARFALTSNDLTEEQNQIIINNAMNDIVILFPGIYKKVKSGEVKVKN